MTDHPSGLILLHPAHLSNFVRTLDARLCDIREVSLRGVRSKSALLARIARHLGFPAGIGHNWDSLADALRDVFWPPQRPHAVLILRHARALHESAPDDFQTLLQILEETCTFHQQQGQNLQIVLDSHP